MDVDLKKKSYGFRAQKSVLYFDPEIFMFMMINEPPRGAPENEKTSLMTPANPAGKVLPVPVSGACGRPVYGKVHYRWSLFSLWPDTRQVLTMLRCDASDAQPRISLPNQRTGFCLQTSYEWCHCRAARFVSEFGNGNLIMDSYLRIHKASEGNSAVTQNLLLQSIA